MAKTRSERAGPKKERYEPVTIEEALGYLVEECGEVLAAAGKTIRWGGHSYNPELKPGQRHYRETNWQWLDRELGDLKEAIKRVERICYGKEQTGQLSAEERRAYGLDDFA